MNLEEFFSTYPKVAVAFSGGVDSAYLLYMACKYAEKVKAYYVKSAFQPQFELEDAERFAKELKADMAILRLDVLSDEKVRQNPPNRCYYCKKRIFTAIREHALNDGFQVLLDGTNASDDAGDRPGMVALQELSVLSPLRLCGLTKQEIRMLSKKAGLLKHSAASVRRARRVLSAVSAASRASDSAMPPTSPAMYMFHIS